MFLKALWTSLARNRALRMSLDRNRRRRFLSAAGRNAVLRLEQLETRNLLAIGGPGIAGAPISDAVSVATESAGDATADESGDTGLFTFRRSLTAGPLTADFKLHLPSSVNPSDYVLSLAAGSAGSFTYDNATGIGAVTFPTGESQVTVTLAAPPEGVQVSEAAEPVTLDIVPRANDYIAGAPPSATVTIAANGFIVVSTLDSGEGSLRQATLNANAIAGADTITFAGPFTSATPQTIELASELVIDSNLTIQGTGAGLLKLSGNQQTRVLRVSPDSTATVSALTIADGNGASDVFNSVGGGVFNQGNLTLRGVVVSGNVADENDGGGIENFQGSLTLINSTVSGNTANSGGGVDNATALATLTVINSTISGNSALSFGGGISNFSGSVTVVNSTISGNTADTFGGGIYNIGSLIVNGSTITGNRGLPSTGGIFAGGDETLSNTIVAGNFSGAAPATTPSDIEGGTIDTAKNNLIGDADTAGGIAHDADGDRSAGDNNIVGVSGAGTINVASVIGPLADNGGPTQTHELVAGSPAKNAGSNALLPDDTFDLDGDGEVTDDLPFDQRGAGFDRVVSETVDIGAFEFAGFPWHNYLNPLDAVGSGTVTPDGSVVPGDALAIINYINGFGPGPVPANASLGLPHGFLDTADSEGQDVADNFIAPNDALAVINAINAGEGGEGEHPSGAHQAPSDETPGIDALIDLLAADMPTPRRARAAR